METKVDWRKKIKCQTFETLFHPKCGHWSCRGREDTDFHGGKVDQGHDGEVAVSSACLQDLGADLYIQGLRGQNTDSWIEERQPNWLFYSLQPNLREFLDLHVLKNGLNLCKKWKKWNLLY